jgi:GntR family phosphonate transport system transcriptional regulator
LLEGAGSITAALAACGVADYTRASTRLTAKAAKPMLALALNIKEGAPVLRTVAVNVDAAGVPIEYGTTWFAGDRITLTVDPA